MIGLIQAAKDVRDKAHCPYSGYSVGAAVLDEQGRVHVGCNVENVSYPVGSCAERNAIARMVSEGGKLLTVVALATKDGGTPCGMCLQALLEFAKDPSEVRVLCVGEDGQEAEYNLAELLPHGFRSLEVS